MSYWSSHMPKFRAMNREIKFRAWHKYCKVMEYNPPIYGNPKDPAWIDSVRDICDAPDYALEEGSPDPCIDLNDSFKYSDMFIWMQYTGLKDKNGVEIYEGDIYTFGTDLRVMEWEEYMDVESEFSGYPHIQQTMNHAEVIGNIYENPELLNE